MSRDMRQSLSGRHMLDGQDVVILLKLAGHGEDWTVRSLEADLGISRAGAHRSLSA